MERLPPVLEVVQIHFHFLLRNHQQLFPQDRLLSHYYFRLLEVLGMHQL